MIESNKLSIVIPNRNRDLNTVLHSLKSVCKQLDSSTILTIVDYGSRPDYQKQLEIIIKRFPAIHLIVCPTQQQLWNKSRAINIVLKSCTSDFFMVCDMDMIWHPDFLRTERREWHKCDATYYPVGMLSRKESVKFKNFKDYRINFQTSSEATGMTVFKTQALQSINGFDEYYHGWGAEDTDAHNRLKNAGFDVCFKETVVYFLHQWHTRKYRSVISKMPYHIRLERINHEFSLLSRKCKRTKANLRLDWGLPCNQKDYDKLQQPDLYISSEPYFEDIAAICAQLTEIKLEQTLKFFIVPVSLNKIVKANLKKVLWKKKGKTAISMEQANELLLEQLVTVNRNCPYSYFYDRKGRTIELTIYLRKIF